MEENITLGSWVAVALILSVIGLILVLLNRTRMYSIARRNIVQSTYRASGILSGGKETRWALSADLVKMNKNELLRALQEVRLVALTDPLTSLANRASYDLFAADLKGWHVTVDVNNLKYLNDKYGYRLGDNALTAVAKELNRLALNHDGSCWRTGGDEFRLVFSKKENAQEALHIAAGNVFNSIVSGQDNYDHSRSVKGVSFSWGIGESPINADFALMKHKAYQEKEGFRTLRGDCPHMLHELSEESFTTVTVDSNQGV